MTDIVDRLREQGEWRSDKAWDGCPIAEEAADAITRLREENARLRVALRYYAEENYNGYNGSGAFARAAIREGKKIKAEAACPKPDEAP